MTALLFLVFVLVAISLIVVALLHRCGRLHLWPVVLLIVCAPLEVYRAETAAFNVSLFRLALVVAVVAALWDVVKRPPRRIALPAVIAVYAALVVLQIVSVLAVTPAQTLGTKFVLQYVGGLTAVAVILRLIRRRDVPALALAYVCSALLPAVASVWRVLIPVQGTEPRTLPGLDLLPLDPVLAATRDQGSYLLEGIERMQGTHADPNHFAFFLATVLLVIAGLLSRGLLSGVSLRDTHLRHLCLSGAIGVVLLVGTYSRSGWLLAALGFVLAVALTGRTALRALCNRRRMVVALVAVAAGAAVAAPAVLSRLNPSTTGSARSTDQHLDTMRIAVDLLVAHPISGAGLGGYGRHADQPAVISSSHSTILTTAAACGAPGALLLLAVFALTAFWGRRTIVSTHDPGERALGAFLLGAWLAMALANLLYEVWLDDFQWVLFALVLAGTRQPSVQLAPLRASIGLRRLRGLRTRT